MLQGRHCCCCRCCCWSSWPRLRQLLFHAVVGQSLGGHNVGALPGHSIVPGC
jgi:hypothetical protein